MARLPRTGARQHRSRRADRNRLVSHAADRAVAPADWAGLVILRGRGRPLFHAGTARRRRGGLCLQPEDRRAALETHRQDAVLGIQCRRWSSRDANPERRPRLYARWDRSPQRAQRRRRFPRLVAQRGLRYRRTIPDWGIASSPLVVGDVVIVATAGWLAAYDAVTGSPRWFGPKEGWGYSSPHLSTIDGVAQIVLVNGPGAIAVPHRTAASSGNTHGRATASSNRR